MKYYKKYVIPAIVFLTMLCLCSCNSRTSSYKDLGCPTKEYYQNNLIARCVWDMTIFDDKLYIGCGDYNNNSGPTPVLYCDLSDLGNWKEQAVLQDEQLGRFLLIDDKLTIPGFDPIGSPELGTYYQLENGVWQTKSGLLDGLHNFDLIRYDGKLFAGIGANRGSTPIIASDNGKDFVRIPMNKNGEPIQTSGGECIRSHNFFVLNDNLYASFWYENMDENKLVSEIYRYENGVFVFDNDLVGKLNTGLSCRNIPPKWAKAVINDTLFLTTGHLYYTNDMSELNLINLPEYAQTYDLYVYDNTLYILTASLDEDRYKITVYSTSTGKIDSLKKETTFNYSVHPTSFAVNDDSFFIALGKWWNDGAEQNGTIVQIKRD